MHFRMQFYNHDELSKIIRKADKLSKSCENDAAFEISKEVEELKGST